MRERGAKDAGLKVAMGQCVEVFWGDRTAFCPRRVGFGILGECEG